MNGSATASISPASGMSRGTVDLDRLVAVDQRHLVADVRRGRQQLEVVLALQPLAHDVHVQQPQEAAAKAESERVGGLGLIREGGIVQREPLERLAQVLVAVGVDREEAAEHHRLHLAVARESLAGAAGASREGVSNAELRHVLEPGDHVADLARVHSCRRRHLRGEEADLIDLGLGPRLHGPNRLARAEGAVDHPHVGDDPAVLVELRVEDKGARLGVRGARRGGDAIDDRLEHRRDALAGLGGDAQDV